MSALDLTGHAALVTGGARGIGRATGLLLAERGADIAVVNTDPAADEAVRREIEAGGRRCFVARADFSSGESIEAACKACQEALPHLDILVNNAGITRDKLLWRMEEEDWDAVLRVDLSAAFHFTKHLTRAMAKRRYGRVVNITSVVGQMGNVGQSNYAAAKAGLIGFTLSVARELAARGVTANAVAPGYIDTDMTGALPEAVKQAMMERIPAARFGVARDVAGVVAYLASQEASYINGQVLRVDGGMLMG
jgi:3-oxoacyl-[acyl-carrier protein] reductase